MAVRPMSIGLFAGGVRDTPPASIAARRIVGREVSQGGSGYDRPVTRTRRRAAALIGGLMAVLLLPTVALAHPLGNFTINHYAGIRVEPDRVLLDVVIDQAEIPTFQARLTFDSDGDGEVSDDETEAGRVAACGNLAKSLMLTADGKPLALDATDAGLSFPAGVGGLPTMRTICEFAADLPAPIVATSSITFEDESFPDRIGWREIVVSGSAVTLAAAGTGSVRTEGVSSRLTHYPANLLTQSLADTQVKFVATPGGRTLAPFAAPDAQPLPGAHLGASATAEPAAAGPAPAEAAAVVPAAAAATVAPLAPVAGAAAAAGAGAGPTSVETAGKVPGGVSAADLPSIFRTADVTPFVLLASLLTAAVLGASHALTPGHGKTLMAAYLVGARGTPLHAAGLGLSVTLSHTIGILVLAAVIVGAQGFLPPDLVVRSAPVVAAVSILVIGGWMLLNEARRRIRLRRVNAAHEPTAASGHDHGHVHATATRTPRHTSTTTTMTTHASTTMTTTPARTAPPRTATAASRTPTCRRPGRPSPGAACSCSVSPVASSPRQAPC